MAVWSLLAEPTPALYAARLQLHHALQVAASVGHTHVPPTQDMSHSSFSWHVGLGALIGRTTPQGYRTGLRFEGPTLLLLEADATVHASLDLVGATQEDGYRWLAGAIASFGAGDGVHHDRFIRSPYDLPEHPAAEGAPFHHDPLYAELTGWFANGHRILSPIAAAHEGASPVRCWPHHFDIATLIALDPGAADPESARSVGVGMTPGDGGIGEPYWYVTPWPYPADPELPELPAGGWNTEGWLGAVLRGSEMERSSAAAQEAQASAFLDAAVAACTALLDGA